MRKLLFAVCLLLAGAANAQDARLMSAAAKYQGCVARETKSALSAFNPKTFRSGAEAEVWVWRKVYTSCEPVLRNNDLVSGVYAKYGDDGGKASAFLEGMLASARSFVMKEMLAKWDAQKVM